MKRCFLPLLCLLILLLGGCAPKPQTVFTVEQDGITFTVNQKNSKISDGTHTYSYLQHGLRTDVSESVTITIYYPDNSTYTYSRSIQRNAVTEGGAGDENYREGVYTSGETLCKAILQAYDQIPEDPINPTQIAAGFFCILIGLVNVCFPELLWHIKYWLVVDGGEPSDLYIGICKIGGGLITIVGLITLLVGIF